MSVSGCVKYICRERGIAEPHDKKSKIMDVDKYLFEMKIKKQIAEFESVGEFFTPQQINASSDQRDQAKKAAEKSQFNKTWVVKHD